MNVETQDRAPTATAPLGPDADELLRLYKQMVLIRHFEDKAEEMYLRARVGGYFHVNIGEEATVVGAISALRTTDYLFSTYRDHGHAIARGTDPRLIMAELFGKETGTSKGRGGSMHLFDADRRFMGGWGIVSESIPLAVGAAFACKYNETNDAVMTIFGDGATNSGPFYESLNMAKLWRLPIVFVCSNNQYGMGTAVDRASSISELWKKGFSFGIPGERVDGMDVLACREACCRAMERARAEGEPTLLELYTYRYRGHSVADQVKTYRSDEEVKQWRARDPIMRYHDVLIERGVLTEDMARDVEADVDEQVAASVKFAEESAEPSIADLSRFITTDGER
jgi:pyruvate dehydrogenase E1 component alpha subunit